jgi:hypothetical protein
MGTCVSPESVHGHRFQSTRGSWVQMSVHRVFMGTGVSPLSGHEYRCQSRVFMRTGVSPERFHEKGVSP